MCPTFPFEFRIALDDNYHNEVQSSMVIVFMGFNIYLIETKMHMKEMDVDTKREIGESLHRHE